MIKRRELRNRRNNGIECTYFTVEIENEQEQIEIEFQKQQGSQHEWRVRFIDGRDKIYQCYISTELRKMTLEMIAASGLMFIGQLFKKEAQRNMDIAIKIAQMTDGM